MPAVDKPLRRFTYKEWTEKLGGEREYLKMQIKLQKYKLRMKDDNSVQVAVSRLMDAFIAVTKQRTAVQSLETGFKQFYQQIDLWHQEMTGEEL